MGIGDWGIGTWGLATWPNPQSPIPNPQSPIPNPQSPIINYIIKILFFFCSLKIKNNFILNDNKNVLI
jgi:hypothetical protein